MNQDADQQRHSAVVRDPNKRKYGQNCTCMDACDDMKVFGAKLHDQGLIEIDSSSGSDSN